MSALLTRARNVLRPTEDNLLSRSLTLNMLGRGSALAMGFVSSVLLARLLGPADRGLVAVMISVSTVALAVTAIGQPLAVTYYASRKDANHRAILGGTLLHGVVLAVVLVPLTFVFADQIADAVGRGQGGRTWALAAALVPITFLDWTISNQLLGMLRFGLYNGLKFLAQVAGMVATIVLLALLHFGVTGAVIATGLASVASVIGCFRPISGGRLPTIDRGLERRMLSYGWRVQVGVIFQMVNYRFDVIIMQLFRPLSQVGYYVIAQAVAENVLTIATAFQASMLPLISHYEGDERQANVSVRSLHHHAILAGVAAIANTVLGAAVIFFAYGRSYESAILPMLVLLPGVWFLGMGLVIQSDLGGRGLPGTSSKLAGMAAVVTMLLDFALIPPLGVMGGALASVTAYTTFGVASLFALRRASGIPVRVLLIPTRADFAVYPKALRILLNRRRVKSAPAPVSTHSDNGPGLQSSLSTGPRGPFTRRPVRFMRRPPVGSTPGDATFVERHPDMAFLAAAGLLGLLCLPLLGKTVMTLELVAALIGAAIAWRTPVIPLALGGIPPLVTAVVGSDPLPKGGFTFLFSVWIASSIIFAVMRRRYPVAARAMSTAPVLASFLLLGLMLVRLGVSPDQVYGSQKIQLYIADVLVFLVGAVLVGTKPGDLRLYLGVVLGVVAAGALLFVFKLVSGGEHTVVSQRFALSQSEYPIELGRDSANGLLIATYFVLSATKRWQRTWAVAVTPPLAVAMLASGSRGPVLAFAAGMAVLIALAATHDRARQRLGFVIGVFLIAALVVPLVVPGSTLGRGLSTIIGSASGLSSNGRSHLWSVAFSTFSGHFVFGLGTGGFAGLNTGLLYPHSLLLEMATELGIIGLITILVVLIGFLRALIRSWRLSVGPDRMTATILIALFVNAFVNANFSDPIQGNPDVWIWGGLAVGMTAAIAARGGARWPTGLARHAE